MNREQILLIQLMEESSEVQQNISKTLRFGKDEVYYKLTTTNAQRVTQEMEDLIGVFNMLVSEGVLPPMDTDNCDAKAEKVEKYMVYSKELNIIK